MGLFKFLTNVAGGTADVLAGGVGDFGAKTGELVGKGVKGLREGNVQPLSFNAPQFVGSGLRAGAEAYGASQLGGAMQPIANKVQAPIANVMKARLSPMREGADKALGHFDEAVNALNKTSAETRAILNGIKNPHTLRELADMSQFLTNILPK